MMLVRWMRFSWDLNKLVKTMPPLDPRYVIRRAEKEEESSVRYAIDRSLANDCYWNNSLRVPRLRFEQQISQAFDLSPASCLVATHGVRIIAASVMLPFRDAEWQLITGPCVLPEYRNRGIGTALLHESLTMLREAGLAEAEAVTKAYVPAAKFVYPKFGSTSGAWQYEPAAIAS